MGSIYINVYNKQADLELIDNIVPTFSTGELEIAEIHAKCLKNDLVKLRNNITVLKEAKVILGESQKHATLKNICRVLATAFAVGFIARAIIGGVLLGGGSGLILGMSLSAVYVALSFVYKHIYIEQSKKFSPLYSIFLASYFPIKAILENHEKRNGCIQTINLCKEQIQNAIWYKPPSGIDGGLVDVYTKNQSANEGEYKSIAAALEKEENSQKRDILLGLKKKLQYFEEHCRTLGKSDNPAKMELLKRSEQCSKIFSRS